MKNFCEDLFFFFFFFGDRPKNFCEDLFFFFFGEHLRFVSLVLGLEHSCPWPRECPSSERLSLASDFFCVLGLGLEPCVLDSTSGIYWYNFQYQYISTLVSFCKITYSIGTDINFTDINFILSVLISTLLYL